MALMKHPDVNASWTDSAMLMHKHADVGVAVDLNPGLITPIVFAAEQRGLVEISNEVRSLAERAKAKKLKPAEIDALLDESHHFRHVDTIFKRVFGSAGPKAPRKAARRKR